MSFVPGFIQARMRLMHARHALQSQNNNNNKFSFRCKQVHIQIHTPFQLQKTYWWYEYLSCKHLSWVFNCRFRLNTVFFAKSSPRPVFLLDK